MGGMHCKGWINLIEVLVLCSIWKVRNTCGFFVRIRQGTIMLLQKAMDFNYQYSNRTREGLLLKAGQSGVDW